MFRPPPEKTSKAAGTVLVIDDEPQIRRAVRNALADACGRVIEAATGAAGIDAAAAETPDLIVLDPVLPDIQGLEVCREVRKWSSAPIVILAARDGEDEQVRLLNAGADDYMTKPFSLRELEARVRAHLRRTRAGMPLGLPPMAAKGTKIDFARRKVTKHRKSVQLTPTEWRLLATLAAQAGHTLTHRQISESALPRTFGAPQRQLRVHVAHLRRKIEPSPTHPTFIVTEAGVGYRFELPRGREKRRRRIM